MGHPGKIKIKIKVKGSGRGRPLYASGWYHPRDGAAREIYYF
jgi:hypothetical protein